MSLSIELRLLSLVALGLVLGVCGRKSPAVAAAGGALPGLRGVVTYRQRIALAPGTRIIVQLANIPRVPGEAMVIARQEIRTQGEQVPIRFALAVDPSALPSGQRYVVQARIEEAGQSRFLTHTGVTVEPGRWPQSLEVVVEPAR